MHLAKQSVPLTNLQLIASVAAVAVVATGGGCSATPAELPSALAAAPAPRQVAYEVVIEPERAIVNVDVRRPATDPFVFTPPHYSAAAEGSEVTAKTTDGRELKVKTTPESWQVVGARDSSFRMTYSVAGRAKMLPDNLDEDPLSAPFTGPSAFFATGRMLFVLPTDSESVESLRAEIVTKGGRWPVWTNWGRRDSQLASNEQLASSVVLAGDWSFSARETDETLLQVVVAPSYEGSSSALRALLARVLEFQSEVLGRYPKNSLLLVVAPGVEGGPTAIAAGSALLLFPPVGADDPKIVEMLNRAHYRVWAGQGLLARAGDSTVGWLARGTEEYFALRAMMALELIDDEGILNRINEVIDAYYTQPTEISNLSRECLLAMLIDVTLRADSGGVKTLDHLMRKLLFDLGGSDASYDTDTLQKELETFSGRSWQSFFDDHVRGPARLPLMRLDRAGLIMTPRAKPAYSLGFTYEGKQLQDAVLLTVPEKGPAHKAGLRKGDVVKTVKMSQTAHDKIRIEVAREGVDEAIAAEYMPIEDLEVPTATELTGLFKDWFLP